MDVLRKKNLKFKNLGNVYQTRDGQSPTILDGVYFSIYYLDFFNKNGDPLPQIRSKYGENNWELHFNFGDSLSAGGEKVMSMKGKASGIMTLGELPLQKEVTTAESINFWQHKCYDWMTEWGIPTEDQTFKKLMGTKFGIMCANIFPDVPLSKQRLHLLFWVIIFMWDDVMDHFDHFTGGRFITMREFYEYTEVMCDILEGHVSTVEEVAARVDINRFPYFEAFCNSMWDYRREAIKLAGTPAAADPFIKMYNWYMRSCVWGTADGTLVDCELKNTDPGFLRRAYAYKRNVTTGIEAAVAEIMCLHRNVNLSHRIRANPVFQYMVTKINLYTCWVNDLMSYRKEVRNGENENFVMTMGKDTSPQEAFDKCARELDEFVIDYNECATRLLLMMPGDEDLKRFIKHGRESMMAQWQWMACSKRYGITPIDCHIIS